MNRADKEALAIRGEQVFQKAEKKYQELLSELADEQGEVTQDNLSRATEDAIRNLRRKLGAYLDGMIEMKRLIAEFEFEKDAISTELELSTGSDARLKRYSKRLLSSISEFIDMSGMGKRKTLFDPGLHRSKNIAYLLWFLGGFGTLGLHRFYMGKTGTGIAWFFTGGLFFTGALYDLFALRGMVEQHNSAIELKEIRRKQLKA